MGQRPAIRKLFLGVHMGLGHDGLAALARKGKVRLAELEDTDLLMFINRARDKMKVLGSGGKVLAYLKMPSNRPIKVEALQYIPATFGIEGFNYEKACETALRKELGLDEESV